MAKKYLCEGCHKKVYGRNHARTCKDLKKLQDEKNAPLKIETAHKAEINDLKRPTLIKCGRHFIDPSDVSAIKEAKHHLWIVKLKSEPNPEWPIWLEESEIATLLTFFNIVGADE